ncbi:MAG TPA: YfhO family protein, partial [Promineifilum sp.]|nr:YfhO family protein [Promineifilum sp.]
LLRARLVPVEPERAGQMLRAILVFGGLAAAAWLLLALGLSRRRPAAVVATLAVALLFADLYGLGRGVEIDWNDPTPGFAAGSPGLAFLRADPGIHRLDIATGAWQPNMPMIASLYAARGVYNPLELANYNVYMGAVGYRGSPQYNVLGIKYVIGGKKEPPGDTTFLVPVFDADPAVTVYLNTLALPRAMILFNSQVVADHDAAFAATHDAAFDPARVVVLEGGQALAAEPGQATITIDRYGPNEAAFTTETDRAAYFFLSDVYHPDWQATVDGRPATIEVANYAFRAVYLEPGQHTVEMRFRPAGWAAGVAATAGALVTLVALAIICIRSNGAKAAFPGPFAPDSSEEKEQ